MILINNSYPYNIILGDGTPVKKVYVGDKKVWPIDLNTHIEFEVTVGSADVGVDIPLIALYNETGEGYYNVNINGISSLTRPIPGMQRRSLESYDGTTYDIDEGMPITHKFESEGVYTVRVTASDDVKGARFSSLKNIVNDRIKFDVDFNSYITKIIRYKSNTFNTLDYAFAGLNKCVPADGFVIETPNITSAYASFFRFGDGDWKANATASLDEWLFSPYLLSECKLLKSLQGTFYLCNLKRIPVGFFDAQEQVTSAYDTFKRSALGRYSYVDYTSVRYLDENLDGVSFIPMNLLRNMPLLKIVEGMFNAIEATSRQSFGVTGANTTQSLGYGSWCNLGLLIKADFFWNGKNKGNAKGTLENIDFVFGKINQCAIEPNVFRHISHCVKYMEGSLYSIHWPLAQTISQGFVLKWSTEPRKAEWLSSTTLNVMTVLGTGVATFPACLKANGLFGKLVYNQGLNGTHDIWGWAFEPTKDKFGLYEMDVSDIVYQFPLAISNTNPNIQAGTSTPASNGLSGMLDNITMEGHSTKADYESVSDPGTWDIVGKQTVWY